MREYNIDKILNTNSKYNIIIGEHKIGKTCAIVDYIFTRYLTSLQPAYYVSDDKDSDKYITSILKERFGDSIQLRKDGIHDKVHDVEFYLPAVYTAKLSSKHTWLRNETPPCDIVFDDVDFSDRFMFDYILEFAKYVNQNDDTKIWLLGNPSKNFKNLINEMLTDEYGDKRGVFTKDLNNGIRICVEVVL